MGSQCPTGNDLAPNVNVEIQSGETAVFCIYLAVRLGVGLEPRQERTADTALYRLNEALHVHKMQNANILLDTRNCLVK